MGVASLLAECLQLGVPVDISKLTTESIGLTADQVMELHLEQLLLTRKLDMSEERRTTENLDFQKQLEHVSRNLQMSEQRRNSEVLDLQSQLEQVSKKLKEKEEEVHVNILDIQHLNSKLDKKENQVTSQKDEIENLKAEIQKMKKDLGGLPVQMENAEEDNEDYDTFDWAAGQIASIPRRDPGRSQPNGSTLEESSRTDELQGHDDDDHDMAIGNTPASTSGCTEQDLQVTENSKIKAEGGILKEKKKDNSPKSNPVTEDENNRADEVESEEDTPLQSETSSPAYLLRPNRNYSIFQEDADSDSDISFSPDSPAISEQSGVSTVPSNTNSLKSFPCSRCSKVFKSQQALNLHLFSKHSKDSGIFKCGRCHLGYYSEDELRRHDIRSHGGIPDGDRFPCKQCSRVFNSWTGLYVHQRLHTGVNGKFERLVCEICQKSYASHHGLAAHRKQKHPPARREKIVNSKIRTGHHERKITGTGGKAKQNKCKVCHKPFASFIAYKLHMRTHTNLNNIC